MNHLLSLGVLLTGLVSTSLGLAKPVPHIPFSPRSNTDL
jgi:hypothetical protein